MILPQQMWLHWLDPTIAGTQDLVDEVVRDGVAETSSLTLDQVVPFNVSDDGPQLIAPLPA